MPARLESHPSSKAAAARAQPGTNARALGTLSIISATQLARLCSAETCACLYAVDALALLHAEETLDANDRLRLRLPDVAAFRAALDATVPEHARLLTPFALLCVLARGSPPVLGLAAYADAHRALFGECLEADVCLSAETLRGELTQTRALFLGYHPMRPVLELVLALVDGSARMPTTIQLAPAVSSLAFGVLTEACVQWPAAFASVESVSWYLGGYGGSAEHGMRVVSAFVHRVPSLRALFLGGDRVYDSHAPAEVVRRGYRLSDAAMLVLPVLALQTLHLASIACTRNAMLALIERCAAPERCSLEVLHVTHVADVDSPTLEPLLDDAVARAMASRLLRPLCPLRTLYVAGHRFSAPALELFVDASTGSVLKLFEDSPDGPAFLYARHRDAAAAARTLP